MGVRATRWHWVAAASLRASSLHSGGPMTDHRQDHHMRHLWRRRSGHRQLRWTRAALVFIAGPLARRLFRLRVEGDQHLPVSGPAIIAANHLSFFDHIALALSVR